MFQGRGNNENVTVTGCIQRLDKTGAAYGAATAKPGDSAPTFALTNATVGTRTRAATTVPEVPELSDNQNKATATTGTTAADSSGTTNIYQLVGDDRLLSTHVGHRVEITGAVQPRSSTGASAKAGTSVGTTTEWNVVTPRLRVAAVKMLASSCSE
jgi:hypothetical protein